MAHMHMKLKNLSIKQVLNQVLDEETSEIEFCRLVEYVVLLPETTYITVRSIVNWTPSIDNFWFLYHPTIALVLFRYFRTKDLKFIINKALLVIVYLLFLIGAIYIAAQFGLDIPQIWWKRIINFYSL